MDLGRIAWVARILAVAGLIALTLLGDEPDAGLPLFLVIATATAAHAASWARRTSPLWIAVAEGAVVGVVAAAVPGGQAVLPYLALPLLVGGLAGRYAGVGRVLVAEVLGFGAAWSSFVATDALSAWGPALVWLAVGLALGGLASLVRGHFLGDLADASYRDAITLIRQLSSLSDNLVGGLDPVVLAEQMMTEADIALSVRHAAVFTRGPSGDDHVPLRYSPFTSPSHFAGVEAAVADVWHREGPVSYGSQALIPLRTGTGTVGVLVVELGESTDQRTLVRLQRTLATPSLHLQAALLFDQVRARATSDERNRLAREVHDGVAQDVASLGYLVDGIADLATDDDQREAIAGLRSEVTRVVAELRASVYDLRNEMRAGEGLGQGVSSFARKVGSRSDLTVHVSLDEGATRLRPEIEAELLRIAQEAMNNARKHSGGRNLWVTCTVRPPHAEIEVLDDGHGLQHARPDSHGMRIMRERAESIGATLDVESLGGAPHGTRLRVRLGSI